MEKIVFKNYILNTIIGGLLVVFSVVAYFVGWIEEGLAYIIGTVLILLSLKRFIYSFKKNNSKYATLILSIEFFLDVVFAGLLIYLQDHYQLFIGLIVYIRGFSYLIINYIATRKIKLGQYILNIGFLTFGSFLLFRDLNSEEFLKIFVDALVLLVGLIFLQAGIKVIVAKEEVKDAQEKQEKAKEKIEKDEAKSEKKIEKLEQKVQEVAEEHKQLIQDKKELEKQVETHDKVIEKKLQEDIKKEVKPEVKPVPQPEPKKEVKPKIDYNSMTVADLKALAKERNLTGYSQLNKAELIKLLKQQ